MKNIDFPCVIVVGEILFDIINEKKHLGGAPFNFAYHLLHLGFCVRFISRIGSDANGTEILNKLNMLHFPVTDIQTDPVLDTGIVSVELDGSGSPRFDIKAPVAYDHIEFMAKSHLPALKEADCLYFGTLAQRSPKGCFRIQQFLQNMPESGIRFYDINLRPDCYTKTAIEKSLARATILKLNEDELEECRRIFSSKQGGDPLVRRLMQHFGISQVIVTKGSGGSRLYHKNGFYPSHPAPVKKISDSVGAGDAFAAMFCAGTLKKWHPGQSLLAASDFAARTCEISGAIPESAAFYAPYIKMINPRKSHDIS